MLKFCAFYRFYLQLIEFDVHLSRNQLVIQNDWLRSKA